MKKIVSALILIFSLNSAANTQSFLCLSEDGKVRSEISKVYNEDGSVYYCNLHFIQQGFDMIYDPWFANIIGENEHLILDTGFSVQMHPDRMEVVRYDKSVTLNCQPI